MHVAIFSPTLGGGGAERAMANLAGGLASHGVRVDMVLRRAEGSYLDTLDPRVRVVDLGAKRLLTAALPLTGYLRRERPDAMISTMVYTNVVAIAANMVARTRTSIVANEQVQVTPWLESGVSGRLSGALFPLIRASYPRATAVVAVSEGVAADLRHILRGRCAVQVIHNPVTTPDIMQRAVEPTGHPWLDGPDGVPVIVSVGRLAEQKDYGTLLRAFAWVRERREARLAIVGEGPDRDMLTELARGLGIADDVVMPGFTTNPFAWMHHASVFALSSRYEGLPTVLVEAMAVGTPVVSTDCESGPSEILRGGELGALVPVGDAEALGRALLETLSRTPDAARLQARAADFTPEGIAARYLALLGERRA